MSKIFTSVGLINHLADTDDIVIKTHSCNGRDTFTLHRGAGVGPLDPEVCIKLIGMDLLVPGEPDLFGTTDAQTYRLSAEWDGSARLQAAE